MNTTTTSKRITKTDRFNEIRGLLANRPDLVEFIDHEIELLANKNKTASGTKKPTATQTANASLKVAILNFMEIGKRYTIGDIIKSCPECEGLSTSKVSAVIRQMLTEVGSGELVRIEDKRKAYFAKVEG